MICMISMIIGKIFVRTVLAILITGVGMIIKKMFKK